MRIEERQKIVTYKVYVAKDGKEFPSEEDCRNHEKELNGERKKCERCNGTGYINYRMEKLLNEMTCQMEDVELSDICPVCHGKKYLEKVTKWE